MLDLKELERRLTEALRQETEESLKEWLLNKRKMRNKMSTDKVILETICDKIYSQPIIFTIPENEIDMCYCKNDSLPIAA